MGADRDMGDQDSAAETSLTSPVARRFVAALRAIEDRAAVEEMVRLASESTRWWSTGPGEAQSGREGAERFWSGYRRAFRDPVGVHHGHRDAHAGPA